MIEFKLNEKENELAEKFMQEHRHPEVYKDIIGGHLNYIFTPTGIGDACTIKCTICNAEENITDYDAWLSQLLELSSSKKVVDESI